jgi:hypothetical protein
MLKEPGQVLNFKSFCDAQVNHGKDLEGTLWDVPQTVVAALVVANVPPPWAPGNFPTAPVDHPG